MPVSVERAGAALRRPAHGRSGFVEAVLRHVRRAGFTGAPLALGVDAEGGQWFEWIAGSVPTAPPYRLDDAQLVASARLVRGFHDAAASFPGLGGAETVTHGDLGPHNTVFRDGELVALIDWDEDVAPGRRIDDVADLIWSTADLLEEAAPIARRRRGLGLLCEAYGDVEPAEMLDVLQARFERAHANHAAQGRAGAVAVFVELTTRLSADRPHLLGAGPRAATVGP